MQCVLPRHQRVPVCAGWSGRRYRDVRRRWAVALAFVLASGASGELGFGPMDRTARAAEKTVYDQADDAEVRRVDYGANGLVDPDLHRLPDILSYTIGTWQPFDAATDLFSGSWQTGAAFLRLEVVFQGLLNPPGTSGCCGYVFNPFRYGPHPLYAIIEIDADVDVDTGGDLWAPETRYLGMAGRWGGIPQASWLAGRAARDASAFDYDFATHPWVDRSGEDFHFSLMGYDFDVIERSDPGDQLFGPGERWVLEGQMLHRAFGYEEFSFACCQGRPGSYEPVVQAEFAHTMTPSRTRVAWVYPLTNAAAAEMRGETYVEPVDGDASNQHSIHEAMEDLIFSTINASPEDRSEPEFAIIADWELKDPNVYLDPTAWRVQMVIGTGYILSQPEALFVYTDLMPSIEVGDFNGDGWVNLMDRGLFDAYIAANDGQPGKDLTSVVDGRVELINFGTNFSVFDVNYDGVVDENDWAAIPALSHALADLDRDDDVDLDDFARLQVCLGGPMSAPTAGCEQADLDRDGDVDQDDVMRLRQCTSGPGVPADRMCGR